MTKEILTSIERYKELVDYWKKPSTYHPDNIDRVLLINQGNYRPRTGQKATNHSPIAGKSYDFIIIDDPHKGSSEDARYVKTIVEKYIK